MAGGGQRALLQYSHLAEEIAGAIVDGGQASSSCRQHSSIRRCCSIPAAKRRLERLTSLGGDGRMMWKQKKEKSSDILLRLSTLNECHVYTMGVLSRVFNRCRKEANRQMIPYVDECRSVHLYAVEEICALLCLTNCVWHKIYSRAEGRMKGMAECCSRLLKAPQEIFVALRMYATWRCTVVGSTLGQASLRTSCVRFYKAQHWYWASDSSEWQEQRTERA